MNQMPSANNIQKLVEEQLRRWNIASKEERVSTKPVITISREPGINGSKIADTLAKEFKLDLYSGRIVQEVAKSVKMSTSVISTLDEKGRSMLEDWISIMEKDRNLWSYQYMQHLVKMMGTIARHGSAVILGRGSNFLIQPENQLRLRLIAPMEVRTKNMMKRSGATKQEVLKRINLLEADRRAYIRRYFNADIADPVNYDLVINTAFIKDDYVVEMVKVGLKSKRLI